MFLGGLPLSADIAEHWNSVLAACPSEVLTNIWVVVHPLNRKQSTLDAISNSFFRQYLGAHLLVCDEAHSVQTAWATRSLVDATLLMMQYGRLFGKFKKYVLLSSACCPIINLPDIVRQFAQDDLSWIAAQDKGEPKDFQPVILKQNGGLFEIEDLNYFSQWMALDAQHADMFFLEEKTYVITDAVNKCAYGSTTSVAINPLYLNDPEYENMQLALFSFSYDMTDPEATLPCAPTDEHFFGAFLMHKLFASLSPTARNAANMETAIRNNIRIITRKNADTVCNALRIYTSTYASLQKIPVLKNQIHVPAITSWGAAKFWIGTNFALNNHAVTNTQYSYCNRLKKRVRLTGQNQKIVSNPLPECKTPCLAVGADQKICKTSSGSGTKLTTNFVTMSQTYCDWNAWVPDPENVLRDFNLSRVMPEVSVLHSNLAWFKFNINAWLQLSSPRAAHQILLDMDREFQDHGLLALQKQSGLNVAQLVMIPNFHPVEYSAWSLRHTVNAFIFVTHLKTLFLKQNTNGKWDWPETLFAQAYNQWKVLLEKAWAGSQLFQADGTLASTFWQQDSVSHELRYVHGITADILTASWAAGSPFVRKCKAGCNISHFSSFIAEKTHAISIAMDVAAHASRLGKSITLKNSTKWQALAFCICQAVMLAALIVILISWVFANVRAFNLKVIVYTMGAIILACIIMSASCLSSALMQALKNYLRPIQMIEAFDSTDGLELGIHTTSKTAADQPQSIAPITLPNTIDPLQLHYAKAELSEILQSDLFVSAKDNPDHINDQQHPPADAMASIVHAAAKPQSF